ncbi:MAG: ferritin family protein, partial [Hyphomicrobium sp.]
MESDAVARYCKTAMLLRQQGADELAAVFERLAQTERNHVDQVDAWARHSEAAPPAQSTLPWAVPDTHDASPAEMAQSKLLTPYWALAAAVRHEERSFAFWTYVAAHAPGPAVKIAAERMALEELEHVSMLRRERRKAFHSERQTATPPTATVALSALAPLENTLATFVEEHPAAAAGPEFAATIAADARRAADKLGAISPGEDPTLPLPGIPAPSQGDPIALSEYLADAYLRFADAATSPEVLALTQDMAAIAVYRLATLRSAADIAGC